MNFQKLLNLYDYKVPQDLIAQKPILPRDKAKLLVYEKETNRTFYDRFSNIAEYLPKNAVLVFNDTKVIPARFIVKKSTGGIAKLLFVEKVRDCWKVLSNTKLNVGSEICLAKRKEYGFFVKNKENGHYFIKSVFKIANVYNFLEKYGQTPIPPYIKHSSLSEKQLRENYQTVFAKENGSIAAPTASLHFTKNLLNKIKKQGIDTRFLILHVNLGTFAPLTEENIKNGKLHQEYYEIDKKTADFLNKAKKDKRPIIAVGTTVVRALESSAVKDKLSKLSSNTQIFIKDDYKSRFVDGIITNFHVPKSSLMMLVSAFVGRKKLLNLYKIAIKRRFRFFSFGDGMLIY
ncbi:MAG: tRNA preQ1(34) S-adenosylmethionine ribosyltransferase-isomerase QueA [Candidatus Paceibacterota bacterium]|jgi:S-adenosylmethionine:tRNA ribosyltransferase-isomerase